MEALMESRRIARERLKKVIGKVEDLILVEQPRISEFTHLLKTLKEQNDSLTLINREVENTVDIAYLEAAMFDAFDFEGTVITAKVKLEIKLSDATNNRHDLITSPQTRNRSELREHVKNKEK